MPRRPIGEYPNPNPPGLESERKAPQFPSEEINPSQQEISRAETIARFGSSLTLFDEFSPAVEDHIRNLGLLPEGLVRNMQKHGLRIIIGNRDLKSIVSEVPGLRGFFAKVQSERAYSNSAYLSWVKTAIVADPKERSSASSLALHEYGHGVHHLLLSQAFGGQDITDTHTRLHPHLPPFIQERGEPGSFGGVEEFIADSFSDFHMLSKADFLKRYDEQWYVVLGKIIADASIEEK